MGDLTWSVVIGSNSCAHTWRPMHFSPFGPYCVVAAVVLGRR